MASGLLPRPGGDFVAAPGHPYGFFRKSFEDSNLREARIVHEQGVWFTFCAAADSEQDLNAGGRRTELLAQSRAGANPAGIERFGMQDVAMLLFTVVFFAVAFLYVKACQKLR
jgi:hypothetical protein